MATLIALENWADQLKPGKNLMEMTDLVTLTNFMKEMQVKFGSRWLAPLLDVDYQNFLIEDPADFAAKLYSNVANLISLFLVAIIPPALLS